MDPLDRILNAATDIGVQAANQALGTTKDTKGEDKTTQKNSDTWSPVLMVGIGVIAFSTLVFVLLRKR